MDVGDSAPIKHHPYRVSPMKKELLDKEVQYMLKNDIIEESQSNWSSPCILVPKHDCGFRFCTDFRKVNDKTKSDSFPIPRIADCIDQIGNAKCYGSVLGNRLVNLGISKQQHLYLKTKNLI